MGFLRILFDGAACGALVENDAYSPQDIGRFYHSAAGGAQDDLNNASHKSFIITTPSPGCAVENQEKRFYVLDLLFLVTTSQ